MAESGSTPRHQIHRSAVMRVATVTISNPRQRRTMCSTWWWRTPQACGQCTDRLCAGYLWWRKPQTDFGYRVTCAGDCCTLAIAPFAVRNRKLSGTEDRDGRCPQTRRPQSSEEALGNGNGTSKQQKTYTRLLVEDDSDDEVVDATDYAPPV